MESERRMVRAEGEPRPLFKVTLMRHEKPYYKDEGHDLTPEGVEGATKTGTRLRETGLINEATEDIYLVHSPVVRAKGTLDFVAKGAGLEHLPQHEVHQLRKSDFPDYEAFMARIAELNHDQELVAKDHYTHPMHQEGVVIEPHQNKRERLYRAFEYLIRWLEKSEAGNKTPHVIAVSHYEVITHLLNDTFGIENLGTYNSPAFGEAVTIEARESSQRDRVILLIGYGGQTKEVVFDRSLRTVEPINKSS